MWKTDDDFEIWLAEKELEYDLRLRKSCEGEYPRKVSIMQFVRSFPKEEIMPVLREYLQRAEEELGEVWQKRMAALHAGTSEIHSGADQAKSMENRITRLEMAISELSGKRKPRIDAEEVAKTSDFFEVIQRYVPNARIRGSTISASCPFHKDAVPSFSANQEKKVWFCFSCNERGNLFQFVMKMEDCDFQSALKLLA